MSIKKIVNNEFYALNDKKNQDPTLEALKAGIHKKDIGGFILMLKCLQDLT